MSNEIKKLSDKELWNLSFRWTLYRSLIWNYEKMQAAGYLMTVAPTLNRLYKDDETARLHAYEVESQFFNCETNLANIIFGMDVAIQEEYGENGLDMVQAIKTSLMGPFSGIGDTLFSSVIAVIFGSIAVTTGLEGNYIGTVIWLVWLWVMPFVLRPWLCKLGYQQGLKLTTTLSDQLSKLTKAGTILGITVIGSMIATMVKVNFGTFTLLGVEFNLQTQLLDAIMPKVGSAIVAGICYWFLGKFGMKSSRLIFVTMIVCILLSWAGVLVV